MINVNFELSSTADWIVVGLTFVGVCIAGYGLFFAKKTVNNWKNEKHWDIILEALENVKKTEEYYDYLLESFRTSYECSEVQRLTNNGNDTNRFDPQFNLKIETNADIRFSRFDDVVFLINEKLKHIFPNKENTLKEFYKLITNKIIERQVKISELEKTIDLLDSDLMVGSKKGFREHLINKAKELEKYLSNDEDIFRKSLNMTINSLKNKTIESFL